ncbi:hypothetical protein D9V84_00890 [Bacteroidetes/Chlorobi group bacterium Naka2016]|jgi:hypothetical protein|nr:MAG: hypothetical protein D9V84_00890 [Bacteroidetes/Chlorobi group bacterium Naka2016]
MKASFFGALLWIIITQIIFAQSDSLKKILISQIEFGKNTQGLNQIKVEAAMNLVARFSNKFVIIPFDIRDSVAKTLDTKHIEPTPYNLAKELSAEYIFIIRINRLANVLRVDISSYNISNNEISNGKGYALIRYFKKETNEPVLDPALLTASQRAFAEVFNEPYIFNNLEGSLRIKPAPTLVIGSINYVENDTLAKWDIFQKKQVTSYFAIETIFEIAKNSSDFVVFDNATRDSIYAYFNLFEPENYSSPNIEEIKALLNFEVEYYIAGEFFWENNTAKLKLYLCKITDQGLEIIKETVKNVEEDKLDSYKTALETATKELLNIKE